MQGVTDKLVNIPRVTFQTMYFSYFKYKISKKNLILNFIYIPKIKNSLCVVRSQFLHQNHMGHFIWKQKTSQSNNYLIVYLGV